MVRDLRRIDVSLGDGNKVVREFEKDARKKMGKSLYAAHPIKSGTVLSETDIVIKSPGGGIPPYKLQEILGKKTSVDIGEEQVLNIEQFDQTNS